PVLAVIHDWYFVFYMLHLLTVKKYPFTIPYIFLAKIGGLFDNFTKKSQFSLSEVAAPKFLHYSVHISGESCRLY
ncbi:MAG: hypothetical protein ACLTMK_02220, partial [Christensenellaceae bacterium]